MRGSDLEREWTRAPPAEDRFDASRLVDLPGSASRYLSHAIRAGAPLADAVRLRMHGEIRLNDWVPFEAEQVIRRGRGMIWRASSRVRGLPVRGSDRIIGGRGAMRWRLLGLLPVLSRAGPDINRSTAGRLAAELVWLPSALARPEIAWSEAEPSVASARLEVQGFPQELRLTVAPDGALREIRILRWGDPDGEAFQEVEFGGPVEKEARFGDFTVPIRLRIGWHPGTGEFAGRGEFFRVTVDHAEFR
jgi:hypothetical protein